MSQYFNAHDLDHIRQRMIEQYLDDIVISANRLALLVNEDSDRDLFLLISLAVTISNKNIKSEDN